jgi:hypothetical protein
VSTQHANLPDEINSDRRLILPPGNPLTADGRSPVMSTATPAEKLQGLNDLLGAALRRAEENCPDHKPTYDDVIVARDQVIAERNAVNEDAYWARLYELNAQSQEADVVSLTCTRDAHQLQLDRAVDRGDAKDAEHHRRLVASYSSYAELAKECAASYREMYCGRIHRQQETRL